MSRLFALAVISAAWVWAHDLYLKPRAFRLVPGMEGAVEFHNGDAFPRSQSAPVLGRLRDARAVSAAGEAPISGIAVAGPMAVGRFAAPSAGGGFVLAARTTPNFIQLAAPKFEQYLRHEHQDAVLVWRKEHGEAARPGREIYSKYVKSILRAGDGTAGRPRIAETRADAHGASAVSGRAGGGACRGGLLGIAGGRGAAPAGGAHRWRRPR